MEQLIENTFASACYDMNTIQDLRDALAANDYKADCENWKITPEQWKHGIELALAHKLNNEAKQYFDEHKLAELNEKYRTLGRDESLVPAICAEVEIATDELKNAAKWLSNDWENGRAAYVFSDKSAVVMSPASFECFEVVNEWEISAEDEAL